MFPSCSIRNQKVKSSGSGCWTRKEISPHCPYPSCCYSMTLNYCYCCCCFRMPNCCYLSLYFLMNCCSFWDSLLYSGTPFAWWSILCHPLHLTQMPMIRSSPPCCLSWRDSGGRNLRTLKTFRQIIIKTRDTIEKCCYLVKLAAYCRLAGTWIRPTLNRFGESWVWLWRSPNQKIRIRLGRWTCVRTANDSSQCL